MKHLIKLKLIMISLLLTGLSCRVFFADMQKESEDEQNLVLLTESITDSSGEKKPLPDGDIEPGSGLMLTDEVYWQQDEDRILIVFEFSNPEDLKIQEIELIYTLFDADGLAIKRWNNVRQINSALKSFGLVEIGFIDKPLKKVNNVGLEWVYQTSEDDQVTTNAFMSEKVKFWQHEYASIVSGIVNNLTPEVFQYISVNVLLFDQDGIITGGGVTDIPFIHANGDMAFMAFVDVYGPVDTIKAFPYEAYQTVTQDENQTRENEFIITNSNFYLGEDDRVYGGFEVTSHHNDVLINTHYLVTLFDAYGFVTATGVGVIEVFLPGDHIGFNPFIYLPANKLNPDSFKIDFLPGYADPDYVFFDNPYNVLSTELISEDGWVRVMFVNNHTNTIRNCGIHVLAYDQDDTIIGGAQYWESDSIPSGDVYEKDIWISYYESRPISSVRAWVAPISMTITD